MCLYTIYKLCPIDVRNVLVPNLFHKHPKENTQSSFFIPVQCRLFLFWCNVRYVLPHLFESCIYQLGPERVSRQHSSMLIMLQRHSHFQKSLCLNFGSLINFSKSLMNLFQSAQILSSPPNTETYALYVSASSYINAVSLIAFKQSKASGNA